MTDIYRAAKRKMNQYDIAHSQSDLFLRKNAVSIALIKRFDYRECVREFIDDVDGDVWFEIFFAYVPLDRKPITS